MLASIALIQSSRVRFGAGFQRGRAALGRGDIAGNLGDGHARIGVADFIGGLLQRFGAARRQRHMHAFAGKRHRAGASQSLARCADDGATALDA